MKRVWNAPATASGTTRALVRLLLRQLRERGQRACGDRLRRAVAVGRVEPEPFDRGEHVIGVPTEHGTHARRFERAGRGHLAAPDGGQRHRGVRVEHARDGRGGQLTDGMARHGDAGRHVEPGRGQQGGGHHERLGHRRVLDLLGVRRGAEALQVEADRRGPPRERGLGLRVVEPRGEHAGGLRSLSRSEERDHGNEETTARRFRGIAAGTNSHGGGWRFPPKRNASHRGEGVSGCRTPQLSGRPTD
jgi:hypothetical protein